MAELERLLGEHGTPGAAIGILDGAGEPTIVAAGTRGDGRGPITADTIFAAASLTKPLFALGVLRLIETGALDLDRSLTEYLPHDPYAAGDERAATITTRMVLSHTTGFPNWRDPDLYVRWEPGTRWGYSGEGLSYLQLVVERVTGAPVGEHLADVVLGPLGMTSSTFAWVGPDEPRLAIGHTRDGTARAPFRPRPAKAAAGGLFTTAADYLRFLAHCLVREHRLLEPQVRIDDALGWALGWGVQRGERDAVWQWGNDPGYKHVAIGDPADGSGVVVLTNGDRGAEVYGAAVRTLVPGPHPALETRHRPAWIRAMAHRPTDLRHRLDSEEVRALLADADADQYRRPGTLLLGVVTHGPPEETGVPIGTPIACVGLDAIDDGEATITALAVHGDWRRQGLAGSLVYGACQHVGLRAVEAEAEGDAAAFFRAIGFEATSRGRWRLQLPDA